MDAWDGGAAAAGAEAHLGMLYFHGLGTRALVAFALGARLQ